MRLEKTLWIKAFEGAWRLIPMFLLIPDSPLDPSNRLAPIRIGVSTKQEIVVRLGKRPNRNRENLRQGRHEPAR